MAESIVTPLQLTAGVGLYSNTALTTNAAMSTSIAAYQALGLIANLHFAMSEANNMSLTAGTISNLISIGSSVSGNYCPALGDTIASNITLNIGNVGYSNFVNNTGGNVLGAGTDTSKFLQAYGAVNGYIMVTNPLITSAANANSNDYLGPTFDNQDDLITGDMTKINLAFEAFGEDLTDLGELFQPSNYGTPAALLQQLNNLAGGTMPAVRDALLAEGLTLADINDLVTNNVESLFNPEGLTEPEFNALQQQAYPGLCNITGDALVEILTVFGVTGTTAENITSMCQLLNPIKIFPRSFASLTLPTPNGPVLIYNLDGTVNDAIAPTLNSGALSPVGCDELGKIIPRDQAAANRALQISFAQLKGVAATSLPQLAGVLV